MLTTILVALITAVIGPLLMTWFKNKLETKPKISSVKEAIDLNELVDNQLDFFKSVQSNNRFDWLTPSILRAFEGAVIIGLTAIADLNRPAAFLLLFAIIYGHYDNLYRALQGERKPRWLSSAGVFILGRLATIAIFIALSWSITPLVWYFSALFLVVSSIQWVTSQKLRIV